MNRFLIETLHEIQARGTDYPARKALEELDEIATTSADFAVDYKDWASSYFGRQSPMEIRILARAILKLKEAKDLANYIEREHGFDLMSELETLSKAS